MRPLYLEMTAFGSYAQKTELPFEKLKPEPYLVTGDTGAGKTTIFDAIMFALYGTASGADRRPDMLHCDYVPKSTDTLVSLRFLQGGKQYTVERKIHFRKKRGTADQYEGVTISALIKEPDAAPVEGAEKVTKRCEELLGLNAEQFSRIIMLAQGEFRKFLKADSDQKNEILGKLFDNSVYVYYQNLLTGARDELRKQRGESTERLRSLMGASFQPPESFHGEEEEAFLPDHPELIENLSRLIGEEADRLEQLKTDRDDALRKLGEIDRRRGEAKTVNDLLDQLGKAESDLAGLETLDGEMERRRAALERADIALHKALPAIRSASQAEEKVIRNESDISDLKTRLTETERQVKDAQSLVEADQETSKEKDRIVSRIREIDSRLPLYADLRQKEKEKAEAEKSLNLTREKREAEEEKLPKIGGELALLREKLERLESIDRELASCQNAFDQAADRVTALEGEKGLMREVSLIRILEQELETAKEALLERTKAAENASLYADQLYRKYIDAQASVLAGKLREKLDRDAEAVCPVCGTHVTREQAALFAQDSDEAPAKEQVEQAQKEREKKEQERGRQYASVESKSAALLAKKQTALERAAVLLPGCGSWETLAGEGYLSKAAEDARKEKETRRKTLLEAENRRNERDEARKLLPKKEQELETVKDAVSAYRDGERKQEGAVREAESAIRVLKSQLSEESEQQAKEEKNRLEQKRDELARQIETHASGLLKARSERDTVRGSLTEKESLVAGLKAESDEAKAERDRVLAETEFDSPEAVNKCLDTIMNLDPERWIRTERQALSDHETGKTTKRELIGKLKEQTDGKQKTDLASLEETRQQTDGQYRLANDAYTKQDSLLRNHRMVKERAAEIKKTLMDSDRGWNRLDALASLAAGTTSESGKLSFDRYVMGAMFREVLEMANRRMSIMTGGRYELVHKIGADRRNAKAGLEIEVLDNTTGQGRGAGSLSGGEGFMTSLALALGLSDVVQNHAGGRQMDALFIDEGFGSLSDDALDKAMEVLNQLAEGNRLVGIISHVDKLDESIQQKIRVKNSDKGSTLKLELAQ